MTLLPLLVMREGVVVHAALAHEKSAEKTLETKMLWEVHPSTQRVIPAHPHISITTVSCTGAWYVAHTTDPKPSTKREEPCKPEEAELPTHAPIPVPRRETTPASESAEAHKHEHNAVFLHTLYDIVAQRNRTRPQGSYTTHLFTSGSSKIKKKLGEEVIEVILAQSQEELSSEVADLLYHLMVLLVHSETPLQACIEVLQQRHAQ